VESDIPIFSYIILEELKGMAKKVIYRRSRKITSNFEKSAGVFIKSEEHTSRRSFR